jgi:anti-sigma B factor antagonist
MDVALEIHPVGPWTVVEIAGELDMHSAPPVRDRVIGLIHDGSHRIALDLTKVDFMDSSSLGALVTCLKRARERDSRLVLVGVSGSPMKVLSLTGLDRVFELVDGVDELPPD